MPKLNLATATDIKTNLGEAAKLKGYNFEWTKNTGPVYLPVTEPAPSTTMQTEYANAEEFLHDWSDLTGFNSSGLGVDGGGLYSLSGANPSLALYPFAVGPTETVRLTCTVEHVSGSSRSFYVGFSNTATVSSSAPGSIIAGINNSVPANFRGSGIPNSGFTAGAGGRVGTETLTITAVATPETISICVRRADNSIEGNIIYPRSAMPNIVALAFWNWDTRGVSGHKIKAFGVKRSLTPFRTKVIGGQTIEGESGQVMRFGASKEDVTRVHVPKGATGATLPIVLYCHAVFRKQDDILTDISQRPILTALENAGYTVVSCADDTSSFRWGNSTSIARQLAAVDFIRQRMIAGGLVILTVSGGTVVGHNLISRRELHARGIYSVAGVLDMPNFYSDQVSFQGDMNTAHSATDLTSFTTNSSPYDPTTLVESDLGVEYTNKRARFAMATEDATVDPTRHTLPFKTLIEGKTLESDIVYKTGGHLSSAYFDSTDIVDFFNRCY